MKSRNASWASEFDVADCSIATMLAAVSGLSQIPRYVRTIRVPMSARRPVAASAATSTSGSMISRSDSRNSSAFDPKR